MRSCLTHRKAESQQQIFLTLTLILNQRDYFGCFTELKSKMKYVI